MADVYCGDLRICRAGEASNFFKGAIGLMFKRHLEKGDGLLIEFSDLLNSHAIHSFFMRFTIDLIFVDASMAVVDLKTLTPWGVYDPKMDCRWVLEVNEGIIKRKSIEIGDQLEFRVV